MTIASDGSEDGGMDYSNQLATFSRPPDGAEIAYLGTSEGHDTLKVANADGTAAKVIVDDPCCRDMLFPAWSNDGTRIGFTASATGDQPFWAYVVDADGSNLHRLFDDGTPAHNENGFAWSPDDTLVAMQRWFGEYEGAASVRPITIVNVATGDLREVGSISYNGFKAWHWSPDGKSIIAAPDDGTDRIRRHRRCRWHLERHRLADHVGPELATPRSLTIHATDRPGRDQARAGSPFAYRWSADSRAGRLKERSRCGRSRRVVRRSASRPVEA